ncbi:hypothetical protein [Paraburkholderia hospita]|uniref:hypothetical protein n=1 Tax=Paraburkholderia hospita TaxID=169430 RepID=UPI000B343A18|nr:hypothetical protein [Paraburkholderia hospita]AXF04315.1 hypothetical protein CUJ88_38495 [Paraburkholderia hospita]OUL96218.1 hypothetical protein CA603_06030 [Paraburkholderia hospita]
MNESSVRGYRQDEWSERLLLAMKTSLSVAHELGLSPDAVLDCAARHLQFDDFTSFASAIQGASRVHDYCGRRENIPTAAVAYIKHLASRVESDRNVLAGTPTMCSSDLQIHVEAPAQAYDKVGAAVQALKDDVQRAFSQRGVLTGADMEDASEFARALAALMPVDDNEKAYERALSAVLHVRFAVQYQPVHRNADDAGRRQDMDGHGESANLAPAPGGWMQRVKDVVHHPARLYK